jgi:hypothetical protein
VGRLAEDHHAIGVFGIVVVEQSARRERVVDAITDRVTQLGLGHTSVQRQCGDDVHVIDAGLGGHVEYAFDHSLTNIGIAHRRQRQRDVVERDRQFHARVQQRGERVVVERMQQRVADRTLGVGQTGQWLGGVQHPRATRGQLLEAEAVTVMEQDGRSRLVDVEHEARPRWSMLCH